MTERDYDTGRQARGWENRRWGQDSRALCLQLFRKRHEFEVLTFYIIQMRKREHYAKT